ncbi:MAG TPA: hypothetical protein VG796_19665 [Verrucomicrobiales bacterium]|jgi:hypothetical protein|nr:hypothetical protein [Verrucomicrobiales bacterium]
MKPALFLIAFITAPVLLHADEPAIPSRVTAASYPNILERAPFRTVLSLSQSLVLSGVASLPEGKVVTVWDRTTGRSFVVTKAPNPQGWKLIELTESTDLRSVTATISAGDEKLTVRFDPERLTPPKLDNTSKPAPRSEGAVIVEALLRSLHPASAKDFESLPASGQEAFRKSFTDFLSVYPTASDSKRLAFVQRTLEEMKGEEKPETKEPAPAPAPPAPK